MRVRLVFTSTRARLSDAREFCVAATKDESDLRDAIGKLAAATAESLGGNDVETDAGRLIPVTNRASFLTVSSTLPP
jgi:hypothetical protein